MLFTAGESISDQPGVVKMYLMSNTNTTVGQLEVTENIQIWSKHERMYRSLQRHVNCILISLLNLSLFIRE